MIQVINLDLVFSDKKLFENVNIKFIPGNCYGIIGANGAGKSTFLKVLAGEMDVSRGNVAIPPNMRLSVLKQNHFEFDEYSVLDTVIMGHKRLYEIMKEKEALYSKADFTEEDGLRVGDLEEEFANLDGWDAESDALKLLNGLHLDPSTFDRQMKELDGQAKVKVLLAQALFGNPDILLLDEPTNHLDFLAIKWLENFLMDFNQTVIVVSHDRHFLNKVCTHTVDIDRQEAKLYAGNYDFWYESSQLALRLLNDSNRKKEEKMKELENFIARFSANASKSKQATSRKKTLEKINLDDIKPSSRRYPFIQFGVERELGKDVFEVSNVSKTVDGEKLFENLSFTINRDDKVIILSKYEKAVSAVLDLLAGEVEPDSGEIKVGATVKTSYLPKEHNQFFKDPDLSIMDWLRDYSEEKSDTYVRSFLGKMLFSQDQPLKKVKVLSGGEKVRCLMSKLMLEKSNVLILDQPTNHLDLESIQSVNEGLTNYNSCLVFASHDYRFIETIANKVIVVTPTETITYLDTFDNFLDDADLQARIEELNKITL